MTVSRAVTTRACEYRFGERLSLRTSVLPDGDYPVVTGAPHGDSMEDSMTVAGRRPAQRTAHHDVRQVDRTTNVPLWMQLRNTLRDQINSGSLQPNQKLPSESELCELYGVSRTVVREALGQLVADRLIYKITAKGAFVARRGAEDDFVGTTIGFWDEMSEKGRQVTTQVLEQSLRRPTERERVALRLDSAEEVVGLRRLRAVDGRVSLLVATALPARLVPGLESANLRNQSLYDTLRRRYGLMPARAERWIEAVTATPEQARLLEVPAGTPLLGIESITSLTDAGPVEYYYALHRSDQSRLHIRTR
jgi:GntR family transcriptional regulator